MQTKRRTSEDEKALGLYSEFIPQTSTTGIQKRIAPESAQAGRFVSIRESACFTFIDLFAGIGGFRLALQELGGRCLFSSEWDRFAQKTYQANFGEIPHGDIRTPETKSLIPDGFDILCAGFPCQPFSIAGVSKKRSLGRETGFRDKTQGTLFFDVALIAEQRRPKILLLENVKNLVSHDGGKTFRIIRETLEELGYDTHAAILNGSAFTPQNRERIFIVGFAREHFGERVNFRFPHLPERRHSLKDILEENVDPKYTLSDRLWSYLQSYAAKHRARGNGFGYGLADLDGISRTLSARYYKDGSEILIPQGPGQNPRKLTPRECCRLMGYPDDFIINAVSDTQMYKQLGNSVVMPLVRAIGQELVKYL